MDFDYVDGNLTPKNPSDGIYVVNGDPIKGAVYTNYTGLHLRVQDDYLTTGALAAPKNIILVDGAYEGSVLLPAFTDDFYLVNPENIFYRIYLNDDQPYILTKMGNLNLEEPIQDIPYRYNDGSNITYGFGAQHIFNLQSEEPITRVGFQLLCKDGDQTTWTGDIIYSETPADGINTVNKPDSTAPIVATEYYDLQGCRLNVDNARGLVIRRTIDANGHATAAKVIL